MRKVYERPTLEMVTIKMKDVLLQSGSIPLTDDDELPIRIRLRTIGRSCSTAITYIDRLRMAHDLYPRQMHF